jgi:tetratricopeptide (TPR) repeat protein
MIGLDGGFGTRAERPMAQSHFLKPPPPSDEPLDVRALPASPRVAGATMGDAASPQALLRLNQALLELQRLRTETLLPLLHQAVAAVRADRPQEGAELAIDALKMDERCGVAWHILAVCREKSDDFTSALKCYETALDLNPDEPEIANDLGRLAYRMGFLAEAEWLFRDYIAKVPGSSDGANNLANAQRDQFRFEEAIETVRVAIHANPESALLWNTLGTILAEQGEMEKSVIFFEESMRLDPKFPKSRYNRANALLALGDPQKALIDCQAALKITTLDSEVSMMKLAAATMLIAGGELGSGWDAYEARLEPHYADVTHFAVDRPEWTPEMDLEGRRILLIGEQGLGDEILFSNLIPDMIEAVGPTGKVLVAIEHRLVSLYQRSFPGAEIGPHVTLKVDHHTVRGARFADMETVDAWAPIASPLRRFRRRVDDFPDHARLLTPDPARVAHWSGVLKAEAAGRKTAGIVWKSLVKATARSRHFSPFDAWEPVLRTPGVLFVNLQYGDSAEEIAYAKAAFGVQVWTPPGIDLKNDLDDLAALCAALDLMIGPANAATNIAAAVGAPTWLISTPGAWPKLGTDRYPWYPSVRVFNPPAYNEWTPVMVELGEALKAL